MNGQRLGTIIGLELTQRTRSVAWYVLLGVFAVLLVIVTALSFLAWGGSPEPGGAIYSTIVYITLLLVVLVSPTLSGNAINGDRDAATLAPVQVTLATTAEILFGKALAAWVTGLAFVAVSVPFLVLATLAGGGAPATIAVSLVVLVFEVGVISAIGVALSGILSRPLFSVATTYLVVAALVIGTLIAFALVGFTLRSEVTSTTRSFEYDAYTGDTFPCFPGEESSEEYPCDEDAELRCGQWQTSTYDVPRFDHVWWLLAANPFVILADATPTQFDPGGYPRDLFGQIKLGVRSAQEPPELEYRWDECAPGPAVDQPTARERIDQSMPSWFIGMALQALLAAGLLWWAWARTRTPAGRLPSGTRIA
ncbi:ABC transporter permease [Microbacterium sp. M3]|uniref:ABC transporter permease n=1 Tax=Microbacterium arthrosphaerae TaxID=792652 RepID=A0ABU4H3S1_9MICO|nr:MULTISPECIES: ABC transporter permease [Microbacterium]MDW4573977.1 ABC transporter permease [Microbacterium arthrosphaerae]MDW7607832.1 ABC transporter permease [Microbacterium sp. M3]